MRRAIVLASLALVATGCAAARQIAALRQVQFAIDRAQQVDLAGIRLDHVRSAGDVSGMDAARVAAAVLRRNVPLAFTIVVRGENPADNAVTARMLRFSWTLLLNDRETVSGSVDTAYTFAPGQPTDMLIPVRLDLYQFFNTNAREALDVALGILDRSSRPTDIALTAVPVIDTPIGPINYPNRITIVRRTVGGATR
jgi:hypothetical protein